MTVVSKTASRRHESAAAIQTATPSRAKGKRRRRGLACAEEATEDARDARESVRDASGRDEATGADEKLGAARKAEGEAVAATKTRTEVGGAVRRREARGFLP